MQQWFVRGFGGAGQKEAILSLQKQRLINVPLWKGGNIDGVYTLSDRELWKRFQLDNGHHTGNSMEVDENYYRTLIEFMEDSSRNQLFKGLAPQELQHIAHIYHDYLSNLLKKNKIDTIIFSSPPHLIDKLLYRAAKKLHIRTLICHQSIFRNRFFYCWNIEDFGEFKEISPCHERPNLKIENKHETDLWYMKTHKKWGNYKEWARSCTTLMLKMLTKEYGRRLFSWLTRKERNKQTVSGILQTYQQCRDFNGHRKLAQKNVNFRQSYIYFPLHVQPEATTSAWGDAYVDQMLAVEHLAKSMPQDWKIYIKENPGQARINNLGTLQHRGMYFFKRLEKLPQAIYLDSNINTWELTRHSKFVATVTGTAGWEAIKGGKPVLIFAKAWYANLPGVFRFSTGINLKQISRYQIDHSELERQINTLLMKAAIGVVNHHYQKIVKNYNHNENNKLLEKFFKETLLQ